MTSSTSMPLSPSMRTQATDAVARTMEGASVVRLINGQLPGVRVLPKGWRQVVRTVSAVASNSNVSLSIRTGNRLIMPSVRSQAHASSIAWSALRSPVNFSWTPPGSSRRNSARIGNSARLHSPSAALTPSAPANASSRARPARVPVSGSMPTAAASSSRAAPAAALATIASSGHTAAPELTVGWLPIA
jgi:hypothetical protein